ncbi:three-Cys-motif partner protein TcmP [Luteibacter sp. NPDC031894]|uniref:three-Cys-motif partner protein TcmP n=1 Tax=Luteibacter sp. NPDC031894 TaxID=3390572 RepID=UPI003CFCA442
MPTLRPEERYEVDPQDKLVRAIVGGWAEEKHKRLRHYVDISRGARRKFKGNSTYIDLYAGSGRARIRGTTDQVIDGSPLVAVAEAGRTVPFGEVYLAEYEPANLEACVARLGRITAPPISTYVGKAETTVHEVAARLSPTGLHLAFLDPFNIDAMPFGIIETLAAFEHMDLIIHVSVMDLQRNVKRLMANGRLSAFAPGWETAVDPHARNSIVVVEIMRYWQALIGRLGLKVSHVERVAGNRNQPLYWLVLAGRHPLADQFWAEVSNVTSQRRLPF